MPNMTVMRPADAIEAVECWEWAIGHRSGPVAMVFARQTVPMVRREAGAENRSARGAYVLVDAAAGPRRVTLFSTGSEVAVAVAARDILEAKGIGTAVVSMPCWDLFEAQPDDYRARVIGRGTVRVAVEAAVKFGWERWIGDDGGFVGMSSFGASGAADELFRHFGITAEKVVEAALARL